MKSKIEISIILPTYNVEDYIDEAVMSVLNSLRKTTLKCEFIIIDDSSTDRTWKKLQRFCGDAFIVKHHHVGLGALRNIGIGIARGEYILFLDGDDTFDDNILVTLESYIKRADVDLIVFNWNSISTTGDIRFRFNCGYAPSTAGFSCWNKCYRRNLIRSITFPEDSLFEDVGFFIIAAEKAESVIYISDYLYNHRHRLEGISRRATSISDRMGVLNGFLDLYQIQDIDKTNYDQLVVKTIISHLIKGLNDSTHINTDDCRGIFYATAFLQEFNLIGIYNFWGRRKISKNILWNVIVQLMRFPKLYITLAKIKVKYK
ncbi:glycosyltransferase family 2 protein [Weissella cibaria]|uniref:glycosyltransferase family 2 protein n=1 Tax=Weissella cibaria TaxID=137591 RepID=UPI001899D3D7|nr:glycosyltransferase family A protein [Weissella cibaria]